MATEAGEANNGRSSPNLLIQSYEKVLGNHGLDHLQDGFFYRLLLKIEHKAKKENISLKEALVQETQKVQDKEISCTFLYRKLVEKAFFSLLKNLVDVKCPLQPSVSHIPGSSCGLTQRTSQFAVLNGSGLDEELLNKLIQEQNKEEKNIADKENINTLQSSQRTKSDQKDQTMSFDQRKKGSKTKAPPTMASIEPVTVGLKNQFKRTGAESVPHSQKTTISAKHRDPKQQQYYQVRRNQDTSQKGRNCTLKTAQNQDIISQTLSPRMRTLGTSQSGQIKEVRKTDFKLLLKVFKAWKKQIGQRQARKAEEARQMENWVLAMHFYNQSLLTKGLLSLKHAKSLHFGYQNQVAIVSSHHEHMLRIAHFKAWRILTQKKQERKENLYKALNHWGLKQQKRVLRGFKTHLKVRVQKRSDAFDLISQKPSAVFCAFMMSQNLMEQPLKWNNFQELKHLLPVKGQNALRCLEIFYKKQALSFLKTSAVRERQKMQQINVHYKCTLFLRWAQITQKNIQVRSFGEQIENQRLRKIKSGSLSIWQNETKELIKDRKRMKQAEQVRRLVVLKKCMDELIQFCVRNRTQKNNLVMSVNTCFNKLISKSFEGWKFVTAFNAEERQTLRIIRALQNRRLQSSSLKLWREEAESSQKATSFNRNVLLKKVFLAYQQYIENKEIEVNKRQFCRDKHDKNLIATSLRVLKKNMQLCRMERQLKITVFKQMEIYRLQQVVRSWREQIFILQAKKAQKDFSQAYYDQKLMVNSYKTLKCYYSKKKELKEAFFLISTRTRLNLSKTAFTCLLLNAYRRKDLKVKHQQVMEKRLLNNKMHYFVLWSEILRSFYQRRMDKIKDSDKKLLRLAFIQLQQHWARCRQMRQDLRVFFTKQQLMLCGTSLEAWKGFTVLNEEKRRKRRVAQLHLVRGVLEKTWANFKRHHKVCQSGKQVKKKVQNRQEKNSFKVWIEFFTLNQKASKFRVAKVGGMQRRSFSNWKKFAQLHKVHQMIIKKGLHRYACQLEEKAFKAFYIFFCHKRERKEALWRAEQAHYLPRLAKTVLLHWRYQVQLEASLLERLEQFRGESRAKRVWSCFMCLKMITEKTSWERKRITPFRNNLRRRLLRKCLLNLFEHVAKKKVLSYLRQQLSSKKKQEQIWSALVQLRQNREASLARKALSESGLLFRARTLQKSAFYGLMQHKLQSKYEKQVCLHFEQKSRERCFYEWIQAYNDCRGELPLMALGDSFYLRKQLLRFLGKLDEVRTQKLTTAHFQRKSTQFRDSKQKVHALRKLFHFSQQKKLSQVKMNLSEKFFMRKVFKAWLQEHIRVLQVMNQDESIVENPIGRRLEFKIHAVAKQAIEQKRYLRLSYQCMGAFKTLLSEKKQKQKLLISLTQKLQQNREEQAFYLWKQNQTWAKMVSKAEQFHKEKTQDRLQLLGWEMWLISHQQQRNKKALKLLADEFRQKELFGLAFNGFFMNREKQQVKAHKLQIAKLFNSISLQKLAFISFKIGSDQMGKENELKRLANVCSNTRLVKKCFEGFTQHKARSQKGKAIAGKRAGITLKEKMSTWLKVYRTSVILGRMNEVIAKKDAQTAVLQFFGQLQALSLQKRACAQVADSQFSRQARGFFAQIRKQLSQKELVRALQEKNQKKVKREVFNFILQRICQEQQRDLVLEDKLEVFLTEKTQMKLSLLFIQFQNLLLARRIKEVCWNQYKKHVRNNSLRAWKAFVIQQKLNKHSTQEIQKLQRIRYFKLWQSSIVAQQQTEQARDLLQLKQIHSLFLGWKQVVLKLQVVKRTRHKYETSQTRTLNAFHCWLDFVQAQKYFRQVGDAIREKRRVNLQKLALVSWQQDISLKKIQKNLKGYYSIKMQRNIVKQWSLITQQNNVRRIQTTKIRAQIMQYPEYSRPLLILRNLTLFKAFNSLAENRENSLSTKDNNTVSLNVFYLRTLKKAFYSLKVVTESKRRKKQSRKLYEMLSVKRCLNALRSVTENRRREKKQKMESTIFNFLNLKRKAYNSLMMYMNERQQERIKEDFAAKLRNKRIMDNAFLAFRFNKEITSSASFFLEQPSENRSNLNQSSIVILEEERSRVALEEISQNTVMIPSPKHKQLTSSLLKANPSISKVEDLDEVNQPSLTHTFIEQSRSTSQNKSRSRTSNYETGHFCEQKSEKKNSQKKKEKVNNSSFLNNQSLSDISLLQNEISRVEDLDTQLAIARQIYQKRLIFNCFSVLSCYLYEEGDSQIQVQEEEEQKQIDLTLDLSCQNVYCDELTYSKMDTSHMHIGQENVSIMNSKMKQPQKSGSSLKMSRMGRHSQLSGILMREEDDLEGLKLSESEIEGVFDSVILGSEPEQQQ